MKFLLLSLAIHIAALAACSGSVEVRGMPKKIELVPGGCEDPPPDAGDET